MTKNDSYIHLALAFDQNFLNPFYVLLTSIIRNNRLHNFMIHTIATGITEDEKKRITAYVEENNSKIIFYSLEQRHIDSIVMPSTDPRYTLANFYRLFFPFLLSEDISKVIYLDTDIVVIGDLATLYNIDVAAVPFAAVVDPCADIRHDLGIHEPDSYLNSGVLLINLDIWRKQKVSEKAMAYVNKYPERCIYVDQCALNAVAVNNWKKLDRKYNLMGQYVPVMRKNKYPDFLKDKVIVHFNIQKPWDRLCQMRLKYLYYHYYKLSPQAGTGMFKRFSFSVFNVGRLGRNKLMEVYQDYFLVGKAV